MPRPPKVTNNNTVLFITTSVEEGLMFPPNPLINLIIKSCLARAQALHPVEICHLVVEATHVHLIARVSNPEDIRGFMERFKTESSHAINRLLGRRKRTIWCQGYDSPVLLTAEDVVDKIVYIYENPSKDGLADSIEKYPGISTYRFLGHKECSMQGLVLARDDIQKLPPGKITEDDYRRLSRALSANKRGANCIIAPDAWMKCFNITEPQEIAAYNKRILDRLKAVEAEHRKLRQEEGRCVIGYHRLVNTAVGANFIPQRSGRRMLCISSNKESRRSFIKWIKGLISKAREVLARWRLGDYSQPYPLGLYPPSMPRTAELIFC